MSEKLLGQQCVLYDRECIGCLECETCDLDPNKVCDNCGKVMEQDDAIDTGWGYYCDENCAKACGLNKCSHCGRWDRDMRKTSRGDKYVCASCATGELNMELRWVKKKTTTKGVNND